MDAIFTYEWDGASGTIHAASAAAARAALRERLGLKWLPNGAQVTKGTRTTPPPAPVLQAPAAGEHCALCGTKRAKPKARTTGLTAAWAEGRDTATMSEKELFAYFKKTAPTEDVRFALTHELPMPDALRAEWLALLDLAPRLSAAETRRQLRRLQVRRWEWLFAGRPFFGTYFEEQARAREAAAFRHSLVKTTFDAIAAIASSDRGAATAAHSEALDRETDAVAREAGFESYDALMTEAEALGLFPTDDLTEEEETHG